MVSALCVAVLLSFFTSQFSEGNHNDCFKFNSKVSAGNNCDDRIYRSVKKNKTALTSGETLQSPTTIKPNRSVEEIKPTLASSVTLQSPTTIKSNRSVEESKPTLASSVTLQSPTTIKSNRSVEESNSTLVSGVTLYPPTLIVPKNYIKETCSLNTHPSVTGFASGKASEQCLQKGASLIGYFDYAKSSKQCSVQLLRKWLIKDGCNTTVTKAQMINITVAKLDVQLPEKVVKTCNDDITFLTKTMIKKGEGKCSVSSDKIRTINSSYSSNGRCPVSKEVLQRIIRLEDGCGRLQQFHQIITSYPVEKSKIGSNEKGDETRNVYLIGGIIFLLEILLIGGFILIRLWKYHRHLLRKRLSSARQRQRRNVESLVDYNAIQQSEE